MNIRLCGRIIFDELSFSLACVVLRNYKVLHPLHQPKWVNLIFNMFHVWNVYKPPSNCKTSQLRRGVKCITPNFCLVYELFPNALSKNISEKQRENYRHLFKVECSFLSAASWLSFHLGNPIWKRFIEMKPRINNVLLNVFRKIRKILTTLTLAFFISLCMCWILYILFF